MKNFLFAQVEPKLLNALPEAASILVDSETFIKSPQIKEFGCLELQDIKLKSLDLHYNEGIEICYIHKGKYHWQVEGKEYLLYPGDCFITYPWQKHGSPKGIMDIGQISWIIIRPEKFFPNGVLKLGNWSGFSKKEQKDLGNKLINNTRQHFSNKNIKVLLDQLYKELNMSCFGNKIFINSILDGLFIQVMRSMMDEESALVIKDESGILHLEKKLKSNLSHKWSLQEMAEIMGVGQTSLNLLLKRETGFSPAQYLMDLRINAAKNKLMNTNENITEIAFSCGFCSSQHFSAAFKQKKGYSPKDYRRSS